MILNMWGRNGGFKVNPYTYNAPPPQKREKEIYLGSYWTNQTEWLLFKHSPLVKKMASDLAKHTDCIRAALMAEVPTENILELLLTDILYQL